MLNDLASISLFMSSAGHHSVNHFSTVLETKLVRLAYNVATLSPVMVWPMAIIRFRCCVATETLMHAERAGHFPFALYLAMRPHAVFSWLG